MDQKAVPITRGQIAYYIYEKNFLVKSRKSNGSVEEAQSYGIESNSSSGLRSGRD